MQITLASWYLLEKIGTCFSFFIWQGWRVMPPLRCWSPQFEGKGRTKGLLIKSQAGGFHMYGRFNDAMQSQFISVSLSDLTGLIYPSVNKHWLFSLDRRWILSSHIWELWGLFRRDDLGWLYFIGFPSYRWMKCRGVGCLSGHGLLGSLIFHMFAVELNSHHHTIGTWYLDTGNVKCVHILMFTTRSWFSLHWMWVLLLKTEIRNAPGLIRWILMKMGNILTIETTAISWETRFNSSVF